MVQPALLKEWPLLLLCFPLRKQGRTGEAEGRERGGDGGEAAAGCVGDGGSELLQLIGGDWRGELQLLLRLWIAAIGEEGVADPLSVCCF